MAIQQPQSTDKLNSPDHALSHRVFANDNAAPNKSIVVKANGDIEIGASSPDKLISEKLVIAYAIAL